MCTSSGSISSRAVATSPALPVPCELGVALAQVKRQHVVGRAEVLALVSGDRQLRERGQTGRGVPGPGELRSLDLCEGAREAQRAVAAEQRLLPARFELGDEIVGRSDFVL